MLRLFISLTFFIPTRCFSQQKVDSLTIEKIMNDPKWIVTSLSNAFWSADSSPDQNVHFQDIVKVTQGIIELDKTI